MSIMEYIDCDVQKDRTWRGQYYCGIHSVWFRDDSENVQVCPCYDFIKEIEKDIIDINTDADNELQIRLTKLLNQIDEMQKLLDKSTEKVECLIHNYENFSKLAFEIRDERNKAVALLHMLDRTEARHPDVAEFLDNLVNR